MWFLVMALGAGAGMATQAAINSQLGKALLGQPLYAAFWSFASGSVILLVLSLWLAKGSWLQVMSLIPAQPWWYLIGGALGTALVFSSIYLAPKLGVANMLFFMIIGQMVAGLLIDHWGLFNMPIRPVNWHKIVGLAVMLAGLCVFFFAKK